jgi:hypothetical protein
MVFCVEFGAAIGAGSRERAGLRMRKVKEEREGGRG